MSNDNNIPKPAKDGLKSAYKETAQATMAIALKELLALGDVMMELDLTSEDSLVAYARQAERANQVLGYIYHKVNDDRDMTERALANIGASIKLAIKLTQAGEEGAHGVRAEITEAVNAVRVKYKRILDEAIASINNGADN